MTRMDIIEGYLKEKRSHHHLLAGGLPFVTISRQPGAGGHLLAHVIITDFIKQEEDPMFRNWQVFDRELCELIAKDHLLHVSMEQLLSENYKSDFSDFVDGLFSGHSDQYALHKKTFEVIRLVAILGKAIVVGRAACCVTRDLPGGVHIRIVAPEPRRVRWMMDKFKLTKGEAEHWVRKQELDRRKLVSTYFNRDIEDPLLYDAVFNTEHVGLHDISAFVIRLLRQRVSELQTVARA